MKTSVQRLRDVLWTWPLLALLAGCAGVGWPQGKTEDLARQRRQREEEAIREFEAQRDFAEYQAALARWDQSDVQGCEEDLRRLLGRNPNHGEARLLLAEICLATQRSPEALTHVEQAVQARPDDAQTQYTMGLVLDATGQASGALAFYERAVNLDPQNEVYAVGYQTAREATARTAGPSSDAPPPSGNRPPADPLPQLRLPSFATTTASGGPMVLRAAETAAPSPPAANAPGDTQAAPPGQGQSSAGSRGRGKNSSQAGVAVASDVAAKAAPAGSAEVSGKDEIAAVMRKAESALAQGSPEIAVVYFRDAQRRRPGDPQVSVSAALAALRANRPEVAVELLGPVSQRFSTSAQVYRVLGVAYYRQGEHRLSQVALQQALSLDKSSAMTYFLMGCTLARLGQSESAEAHFQQARALDPRYATRR